MSLTEGINTLKFPVLIICIFIIDIKQRGPRGAQNIKEGGGGYIRNFLHNMH